MALLQFRGGVVSSGVYSDDQAKTIIKESIGLGWPGYQLDKKVELLEDPIKYMKDKKTAMKDTVTDTIDANAQTASSYAYYLKQVNDAVGDEYKNTSFAKEIALQEAYCVAKTHKELVDLQYPMAGDALRYKEDKSAATARQAQAQVAQLQGQLQAQAQAPPPPPAQGNP